jgi:hypothetical protein
MKENGITLVLLHAFHALGHDKKGSSLCDVLSSLMMHFSNFGQFLHI